MKNKKSEFRKILEGAETAFDILGTGFYRNYRHDNIRISWYNTGVFFNAGFENFKRKHPLDSYKKDFIFQEINGKKGK